ncbi:DUF11 domain-containing protein [candidate division KSB1 bacterium]|nr:DUF11 domain-containing protein [candidate division KSB1 bacterium]
MNAKINNFAGVVLFLHLLMIGRFGLCQLPMVSPEMDMRFRVVNIDYDNNYGYFDIWVDVRTTDGFDPLVEHITNSLVLDTQFKDLIVSVDTSLWVFSMTNYQKMWFYDADNGVLSFDISHRNLKPREFFGTIDPAVWQPVVHFELVSERRIGETGSIDWNPDPPDFYILAVDPGTMGTMLVHHQEFGGPVVLGLEFYRKIMDICMRTRDVAFNGSEGSFKLFFDVRTTDGSGQYLFQMQDAVIFDRTLADHIVSVELTDSMFVNGEYRITWRYVPMFGILEFLVNHTDMVAFSTVLGGPDSLHWHHVLQFDVNFEMASGQYGQINWYDGEPHLSIRTVNIGGTPNTKLIHNRELCAPVVVELGLPGADIAVSQTFNDKQVNINQAVQLLVDIVNNGPEDAGEITAIVDIPAGLSLAGFAVDRGLFRLHGGTWTLGLEAGERARLKLTLVGKQSGTWTAVTSITNMNVMDPVAWNNSTASTILVTGQGVLTKIYVRAFLEGPYRFAVQDPDFPSPERMATKLRYSELDDTCYIPVISPYADSLYRDCGVVHSGNLPDDIVDWIYLKLRPAQNPRADDIRFLNGFEGISCFLRNDGAIVDLDGSEGVWIPGFADGSYYLQIDHRNHLRIMSAKPVNTAQLTGYNFGSINKNYYDFTDAAEKFFYINDRGQRGCCLEPVNGKWLIGAGDGDGANQVEIRDLDMWFRNTDNQPGYFIMDYDLGSKVEGWDQTLVISNMLLRSPFSWPSMNP